MNRKAVFNVGALIVVVLLILGVGMYFYDGYTGALVKSGSNFCEETETLFPTPDGAQGLTPGVCS